MLKYNVHFDSEHEFRWLGSQVEEDGRLPGGEARVRSALSSRGEFLERIDFGASLGDSALITSADAARRDSVRFG